MCVLATDEAGMVVSWCSSSSSLWKHKAGWFIASYWEHKSHLQRRAFKRPASWQHLPFINDWAEPPMEPETTKLTRFPTNSSFCFPSFLSAPSYLHFDSPLSSPPRLHFSSTFSTLAGHDWKPPRGSVRVSGGWRAKAAAMRLHLQPLRKWMCQSWPYLPSSQPLLYEEEGVSQDKRHTHI